MTELTLGERYAREALAVALFGQRRTSSSIGGAPASLWHEIAPQQRGSWREQADRLVAEQAGDATAVTKDQKRKLERWEGELLALASGLDPDGYHDAKDHRAERDIASYYQEMQPYDYKLSNEVLLNAHSHADALGLDLPAFPANYFSSQAVESVRTRQLTDWEAAMMAILHGEAEITASNWSSYKFIVPFQYRFSDKQIVEIALKAQSFDGVPARSPADRRRYKVETL
ncbi:hypothetical protein CcrKarma_gp023 [Caulobacter virus Karma]|uniref:hypothetical protein n=1 Tax=Caulobacter virus Karma TaxID=1211641 RepID=UPI00028A9762|nr:hypothetical protein CcrKarma_gp023 [Caulobacter virus Karma]AFU87540.1 hypothetical protein CcrKarma_gp023 [Caulobacter virus Karma]